MAPDLPERAQALFDKLKDFPETHTPAGPVLKPHAFVAFLDLRQLWEREIQAALYELRQRG